MSNFSSLTALKIFNAVNAGVELRLATPLTTAASLFFLEKNCIYLDAELFYDHIKQETFQMHAPTSLQHQAWVKRARKRYGWRGASAEQQWTMVRWDVIRPCVSKNIFSSPVCRYTVLVACALQLHAQIRQRSL